jgi:DNA-binding NarL/FixJ family response regulator
MKKLTTLILADDHPMFRLGLKTAIGMADEFKIVGEADDGQAALELLSTHEPDMAILDWQMPALNGLEVLREIGRRQWATQVIILTMHNEESLFQEALDAGVCGFVLKDNAVTDIVECLRTVRQGEVYLSPKVSLALLKRVRLAARLRKEKPGLESLTAMERKVLKHVADNLTTKEIAGELGLSPHTIETHRRNICQKLELRGSHSLLQFALEHKAEL